LGIEYFEGNFIFYFISIPQTIFLKQNKTKQKAFIPGLISSFISSTIYQAVYNRPFGSFFFYQEHLIEVRAEHVLIGIFYYNLNKIISTI